MYNVIEISDIKEFNKLKSSLNYYRVSSGTNLFINNIEKNSKEQFLEKIGIKTKFQTYYEKNDFIEKINSINIKTIDDVSLLYLGSNNENVSLKEREKSINNYNILLKILNIINTDILDENLKNVMTYLGYVDIVKIFYETIGENSIYSTNKIDNLEKIKEAINIINKNSNKLSNDLKKYITLFDDFSVKSIMIDFFDSLINSNIKKNFDEIVSSNMDYILCLFLKACGFSGFIKTNIINEILIDEICLLQDSTNIIHKFEPIIPQKKIISEKIINENLINKKLIDGKKNCKTNCYLRYVAYKKKF